MEGFLIDFKDPLFSVLIFLSLVFIVSFFSYIWGNIQKKDEKKRIEHFVKKFNTGADDEYKDFIDNDLLPFETLMLIASSYTISGDYERVIDIYLYALGKTKNKEQKQYVFEHLGIVYFKAGFLQRSREVFLRALKLYPRNTNVLIHLGVINEKLKDYVGAKDVYDVLEELAVDVGYAREYIDAKQILHTPKQTDEEKLALMLPLTKQPFIQRMYVEFALQKNLPLDDKVLTFDPNAFVDTLWFHDCDKYKKIVQKGTLVEDVYEAKSPTPKIEGSEQFELDTIIKLKRAKYEAPSLMFDYICEECKHVYPLYSYRCPNCLTLGSCEVEMILTKGEGSETDLTF